MSVPVSISSCHLWLLVVISLVHLCLCDQKSGDVLCMDGERQALMQFKHGLIDEAERLASWVGEKNDCCRWAGIVCDNITGHVHEIHLRGLDGHCDALFGESDFSINLEEESMLGGNLSPSLLELKQLKYLDLSCNNFEGIPIPSFIGSLIKLRYLNLSNSNFGGMVPPQIGNISELRVLSLRNMYVINTVYMQKMQWLSSLRWLHHLEIGSIDLSKAIDWFQVINTLPSLAKLDLSRCQLIDMHPHVSSLNITSLVELDLSFNFFDDNTSIPAWIFSQTSLVSLDLTGCNFQNTLPPGSIYSFRNLTSLEALHASSNNFMNSPSTLKGLSHNLKFLDIRSCGISSSVLHSICNMTSLVSLDVADNQLTKAIPKSFGNLCKLRSIDLSLNKFDDIGLTNFHTSLFDCKSSSLESLSMSFSGLSGPIPNSIGRLSSLKMLGLGFNRVNGSIPDSIGNLSSLEMLELSNNQLSGNLPVTLGQLSMLRELSISGNLLKGVVTEAHFAKLVSLKSLLGEGNNLTLKVQVANWIPPFQMKVLSLDSWHLGPEFPLWLHSQKNLKELSISNTHISSPMPPESFWRSLPNLIYLDMSQNHIKGTLTSFTTIDILDLSSNMLTGTLPSLSNGSLMPTYLDLSNNTFVGTINHFLCVKSVVETQFLSLGYNHLSGVIPECWEKWSRLKVLNLEINNFSGNIPSSLGSLLDLQWLNMHGNKLSGRLPLSLMNLLKLVILQLGQNELVGSIPPWIGIKLTSLGLLNLRFNHFDGHIPHELCYLSNTQVLDLANNNLSGNIPRCFNNFSVLSGITSSPGETWDISLDAKSVSASDTLVMKGQEYTYQSFLRLVTLLDLSCNNFSGHIPGELTSLHGLKSLNLSGNQLSGKIPENIGDMEALESFDLSVNKLYGELPISLSRLDFLSSFNVSYNNLTGRVPISTQLQSFNESSFFSNKLCGAPLSDCRGPVEVPSQTTGNKKEDDGFAWGLIISIVLGFFFGFWFIVAPLLVNTSWRAAYYILMRKVIDVKGL